MRYYYKDLTGMCQMYEIICAGLANATTCVGQVHILTVRPGEEPKLWKGWSQKPGHFILNI